MGVGIFFVMDDYVLEEEELEVSVIFIFFDVEVVDFFNIFSGNFSSNFVEIINLVNLGIWFVEFCFNLLENNCVV